MTGLYAVSPERRGVQRLIISRSPTSRAEYEGEMPRSARRQRRGQDDDPVDPPRSAAADSNHLLRVGLDRETPDGRFHLGQFLTVAVSTAIGLLAVVSTI